MPVTGEPDTPPLLDNLIAAFIARTRRGENPSIEGVARAHPELAEEIRDIFPLVVAMEDVKRGAGLAGRTLGPYKVVREIGRGGMGTVYEAVQVELGRRVALKVLPGQAGLAPRFLERFRMEAQAAARLVHPHIVPVIGYGSHEGMHFYSMQFIKGEGLDRWIERTRDALQDDSTGGSAGPFAAHARRVATMALQVAEALAHAHAHGVLHRDVKPANLLMDETDHVWVADFGLCRQEGSDGLTRTGDVLGTFRYMPPERFAGISDVRGDVYGVGITMYELLTRRRAYEEEDAAVLARRITETPPRRPRLIEPRIPVDLETIVRKAMAHDPEQRYRTAEALADDLRAFLAGEPIQARTPTAGYLLRKAFARRKAVAITAAASLTILVASTVWYVGALRTRERNARFRHYAASLAAGEAALRARDTQGAATALADAPRAFRNWAWRHLRQRLDPALRRFESRPLRVQDVAYAPDGRHFATALGHEVWVYDDGSGKVVARLTTEAQVQSARWNPAGDRIAIGTDMGLEIWRWPAGQRLARYAAGDVRRLAFSTDGAEIVAGCVGGTVVRCDADGALRDEVAVGARVLALAVDPDASSERVALGLGTGEVRLLRRTSGEVLWSHSVSRRGIHVVGFAGPERVVSVADQMVRVFRARDGKLLWEQALAAPGGRLVSDPGGQRLLVFVQGRLYVLDAATGASLGVFSGGIKPDRAALHPGGRRMIVASPRGMVREWYVGTGTDLRFLGRHMSDVTAMDVDAQGCRAVTGAFGGVLRIWDLTSLTLERAWFSKGHLISAVAFSPEGPQIAYGDSEGRLTVREIRSGRIARSWSASEEAIVGLAWLPAGKTLVTLGEDAALCLWDAASGRLQRRVITGEAPCTRLAVDVTGHLIATADEEGGIALWRRQDLTLLRRLSGHTKRVSGLAFDPYRGRLASVSRDQTLHMWNAQDGSLVFSTSRSNPALAWDAGLIGVAFAPDGLRIATGSYAGFVRIWNAQDGALLASMPNGHWISALRFTPDGTRLLASMTDGRVRIRDTVPVRDRIEAREWAARYAERARPLVEAYIAQASQPDDVLTMLAERQDLDADVWEAAMRIAHVWRASREGIVARLWHDLVPGAGDPERWAIARALCGGIWRATHQREEPDPRCDTLYALAAYRCGDPTQALRILDRIKTMEAGHTPTLRAVEACCAVLCHAALGSAQAAAERLARIEREVTEKPERLTPRLRRFLSEARASLPR